MFSFRASLTEAGLSGRSPKVAVILSDGRRVHAQGLIDRHNQRFRRLFQFLQRMIHLQTIFRKFRNLLMQVLDQLLVPLSMRILRIPVLHASLFRVLTRTDLVEFQGLKVFVEIHAISWVEILAAWRIYGIGRAPCFVAYIAVISCELRSNWVILSIWLFIISSFGPLSLENMRT